ncbi:hypothetical protein ACMX2H_15960 [Arthrobacter sulfonylureivorans]|uniref:hypothetical protein n=1 Tax=Arthrobacter sulfonylureivorans TaxID=2486855 RepID=UPI0039E3B9AB
MRRWAVRVRVDSKERTRYFPFLWLARLHNMLVFQTARRRSAFVMTMIYDEKARNKA